MGNDGSEGVRRIHEAGGTILAQDAASCTVFGMPREAIATGCVEEVLPVDRIGRRIAELVLPGRRRS